MKPCDYCQADFEPRSSRSRFCSDKCRVYASRRKSGPFLFKIEVPGFTMVEFEAMVKRLNELPRSVADGFYHFDYAEKRLLNTAAAGEAVTITLTKDNFKPLPDALKDELVKSMPSISMPAMVVKPVIARHKKWKEGDPKEGTGGFFMRFGAFTYDDPEFKRE